jgi:predicted dienelactone hydrolase
LNSTFEGKPYMIASPNRTDSRAFPVVVFTHDYQAEWEWYAETFSMYASYGFIIVFPYVESPWNDTQVNVTDLSGSVVLQALEYVSALNSQSDGDLQGAFDTDNIVVAGHGMGGTNAIIAATKYSGDLKIAMTISQHPDLCAYNESAPVTWTLSDLH